MTPSSVTKVVPVVQQNIASFFAKKPQSEGIREITPAVVVGDRKALATKGDNVVLTDKPTKSAEKSALKAKAHADEDSEAEASYCPGKYAILFVLYIIPVRECCLMRYQRNLACICNPCSRF